MPELTVSDELYQQIETAADEKDVEETLWEMVGMYRRINNPEADTE